MDVLRPRVIDLGGRYYRCSPATVGAASSESSPLPSYVEDFPDEDYDEDDQESYDIEEDDKGIFFSHLQFPSALFGFFFGRGGEIKQKLERDTSTTITIPRRGAEGDVVVRGSRRRSVASACSRLEMLAAKGRKKSEWTHLLCIPLNGVADVQDQCAHFKQIIMDSYGTMRGVDASIFQNPLKLHLTLGTLKLLCQSEIDDVVRHLKDMTPTLRDMLGNPKLGHSPVIQIEGIEYMNDDPSEVDILYAKVELANDSNKLQEVADFIVERLVSAGVMEREYDRVKLHATVINTKLRKAASSGKPREAHGGGRKGPGRQGFEPRETFDASSILQDMAGFSFGAVPFTQLHLSQRYTAGNDQFYKCAYNVRLVE